MSRCLGRSRQLRCERTALPPAAAALWRQPPAALPPRHRPPAARRGARHSAHRPPFSVPLLAAPLQHPWPAAAQQLQARPQQKRTPRWEGCPPRFSGAPRNHSRRLASRRSAARAASAAGPSTSPSLILGDPPPHALCRPKMRTGGQVHCIALPPGTVQPFVKLSLFTSMQQVAANNVDHTITRSEWE